MIHDHIELSLEQSLDHCIKCNICTAACPVSAVTDLFPGPKYVGPQAQRFRKDCQPTPDESVDYCSGCRVCNEVCPTGVRIMELNARARARIVEQKGLPLRNWVLGHQDWTGWLACGPQALLANFAASNPLIRTAAERLIGVARKAPLPKFSTYSFRSWFKKRSNVQTFERSNVETAKRQVVYFHGCSTNYYEPRVGKAAVEVLERNGFEVILAKQGCCGLPLLSNGDFFASTSPWVHSNPVAGSMDYSGVDATDQVGSGSARITNHGPVASVGDDAFQCVGGILPGETYLYGGKIHVVGNDERTGYATVNMSFFGSSNCSTSPMRWRCARGPRAIASAS